MLILSKVDIVDTLVPALEPEPEVAVEGCLDERDIALNCLKLIHHHGPREAYSATGRAALGFLLGFLIGRCCLSHIIGVYD